MEVGAKYMHRVYFLKYWEPWVGIIYSKRTEHGFSEEKKKKTYKMEGQWENWGTFGSRSQYVLGFGKHGHLRLSGGRAGVQYNKTRPKC